jgi:hypothetical protein
LLARSDQSLVSESGEPALLPLVLRYEEPLRLTASLMAYVPLAFQAPCQVSPAVP